MNKSLLLIAILVLPLVLSQAEIQSFVNDYADVIAPNEEQQLTEILKQLYDAGAVEYSIVTVRSLEGKAIESYSLELAQGKLGDKEKNNGLLLLVSVEDRQYRFEVGRGIEDKLNDAKIGRIGRTYLVPSFKKGNYGNGLIEASIAVKDMLLANETSAAERNVEDFTPYIVLAIIIIILINAIVLSILKRKSKGKYFDAAAGAIILFGRPPFGGGGFSGSGGGLGGFGGGGFSGGGASGRF